MTNFENNFTSRRTYTQNSNNIDLQNPSLPPTRYMLLPPEPELLLLLMLLLLMAAMDDRWREKYQTNTDTDFVLNMLANKKIRRRWPGKLLKVGVAAASRLGHLIIELRKPPPAGTPFGRNQCVQLPRVATMYVTSHLADTRPMHKKLYLVNKRISNNYYGRPNERVFGIRGVDILWFAHTQTLNARTRTQTHGTRCCFEVHDVTAAARLLLL